MAYQKLQASRALSVIPSDTINIPSPASLAFSSTTTAAAALKLIDAAGDFITRGVRIGDIIYSQGAVVSIVTAVDSATQLSVDLAVGTSRGYDLYASPDSPNNGCVLYVGDIAAGATMTIITAGGDEIAFAGLLAGSFIPVQTTRVKSTGTLAAGIIALW